VLDDRRHVHRTEHPELRRQRVRHDVHRSFRCSKHEHGLGRGVSGSLVPDPGLDNGAQAMSTAARTSGRGRRTGLRHARWVITLPGAVAAATLLSVVAVYAFFAYTDSSNAHTAAAQGGSVGAGLTPGGFSTSGRDVTFSWSSASNALSYTVARSNVSPGSLSTTLHGSCAGSISTTS